MKVPEAEMARVRVLRGGDPASVISDVVASGTQEDPFYVMNLGTVVERYEHWVDSMPRVEPFYAVKCNDDPLLISTLAALGTGFDCASKAEMELVTGLGVAPSRIIFANPAKMNSHIRRAASLGVNTMTFDSETELLKIKHLYPEAQLVLRIRCDAAAAQCPLGMKFGCNPVTEAPRLLKLAAIHELNVVGISFHVGSGAAEFGVYERAVLASRLLFNSGARLGHVMSLLDIGGGFPGSCLSQLFQVSLVVNNALETHFPDKSVRVIAEPGRYFACAAYTLAAMVHSIREIEPEEEHGEKHTMYFINDGVYGSFNCILYDHQQVKVEPLKQSGSGLSTACSIWGPSCDGLDCVVPALRLPRLRAGDWLVFPDMGAYTLPVASPFNGFPVPTVKPYIDATSWAHLKGILPAKTAVFTEEVVPPVEATPPPTPTVLSPTPLLEEHKGVFIECALK